MVHLLAGMKLWLFPVADVPEEEDHHRLAADERNLQLANLRLVLNKDCELDQKIANISELLAGKDSS